MSNLQILTDSSGWQPQGMFPGKNEMGDKIADEALKLIGELIEQARQGKVELNKVGDEGEFRKKRGDNYQVCA